MEEYQQPKGLFSEIEKKRKEIEQISPNERKNLTERHAIVGEIAQKLQIHSYKKISMPFLGKLLSIYSTDQLYTLHSQCNQAKNYAGLFWHFLKVK